jgi:cell division protein FtsQ
MRRVKPAQNLESAKFRLLKRRVQKYLPRHPLRSLGLILLLGAAGLSIPGLIDLTDHGSRLQTVLLTASGGFGLSVQNIDVDGRAVTPSEDVLKALDVARYAPILGVSPEKARQRLQALPWVRTATVERRLPDTIHVYLVERKPLALWQRDGKVTLIDTDGVVIATDHLDRYATLLLVVGEDAPTHTAELLGILNTQPDLMKRVSSAVRVGERRWNLQIDNGITVEMPETGLADAWAHLAEIEHNHALLARDIQGVDLRLSDRVVVKQANDAVKPAQVKPGKTAAKT